MKFKYCYIFDYCAAKIYRIDLSKFDAKQNEDVENIIKSYDIDVDNCEYMITDEELTIEYIN